MQRLYHSSWRLSDSYDVVVMALSWTVYQDTRYDIDARREELKQFLEDERHTAHHENIKIAISIYDEDILPSEQRVWIRGGPVVWTWSDRWKWTSILGWSISDHSFTLLLLLPLLMEANQCVSGVSWTVVRWCRWLDSGSRLWEDRGSEILALWFVKGIATIELYYCTWC